MECPGCGSQQIVRNGVTSSSGKQNYLCKTCHRQFVEHPERYRIPQATRDRVDRLLLEKLSLAGIARLLQVSERWLQYYVNDKYIEVSREVEVTPKKKPV